MPIKDKNIEDCVILDRLYNSIFLIGYDGLDHVGTIHGFAVLMDLLGICSIKR